MSLNSTHNHGTEDLSYVHFVSVAHSFDQKVIFVVWVDFLFLIWCFNHAKICSCIITINAYYTYFTGIMQNFSVLT